MEDAVGNETAVSQSTSEQKTASKPVILKLKKEKKKKKRRYSTGLKDVVQRARRLSNARLKMRKAMVKGSLAFRKRSKKSAKKKRDGAVRDLLPNAGWALSRTMRSASGVPYDVSKALDTSGSRRRRSGLRLSGGRRTRRLRVIALRTIRRRRRRMQTQRTPPRLRLMALRRTLRRRRRSGSQRMASGRRLGLMAVRTMRSRRRRSIRPLINRLRMRRPRRRQTRRRPLRPLALIG